MGASQGRQQEAIGSQQQSQAQQGETHFQSATIDDIVQEDVVTADPDTPIQTISSQMKQEDVGAVVITEDNEPLSVVTDREIALSVEEMPEMADKTAEDVMSGEVTTATETTTVFDALQKLTGENIRRLPIVNEEGELVGIVTLDDIIVLLGTEMEEVSSIIQSQSSRL